MQIARTRLWPMLLRHLGGDHLGFRPPRGGSNVRASLISGRESGGKLDVDDGADHLHHPAQGLLRDAGLLYCFLGDRHRFRSS